MPMFDALGQTFTEIVDDLKNLHPLWYIGFLAIAVLTNLIVLGVKT